jgi:hypothetical protein
MGISTTKSEQTKEKPVPNNNLLQTRSYHTCITGYVITKVKKHGQTFRQTHEPLDSDVLQMYYYFF